MWSMGTSSGRGLGTNPQGQGRVLFSTAGGMQIDGAIWDWSDTQIAVFAPFLRGPIQVGVQVAVNGTPLPSNRLPLTIQ